MTSVPSPTSQLGLDPVIHEATRLRMVAVLNECEVADFNFLLGTLALTRGNLSVHMGKLVAAGYVGERKEFVDRKPHTEYRLTDAGRAAYRKYLKDWKRVTGR
ncbi:MAG: transcriptional regulator [Planctomycetota bacterium]